MTRIQFALITGGSSGLGKALAISLARGGSSVVIVARNEARLTEAKAAIEAAKAGNGFVKTVQADVTDEKQVRNTFDKLVQHEGVPTHLINCAGAANPGYVQDFSLADFEAAMRLDYFGTVIPTITMLPHFLSRGSGHVINVSSAGGFVGLIGYATYCPAKFAVMGFSEVLRHELKPKGIKVSVVCPPDMDTPGLATENKTKPEECKIISQRGKLVKPEDVAKAVIDGVKKGKYYILPGESNYIFNMKRLFPSLVFSIMDGDLQKALKKLGK
ncbi:MAG: SDR family oxidoreductase [Candidatus Sigynarchaeota archaeon]